VGIFLCSKCDRFADSHDGCMEDPKHEGQLICQDCLDNEVE